MPLAPGEKRISVTYNPANAFIVPDIPLLKQSEPTHLLELARIIDLLGTRAYRGIVWVGQMLESYYYTGFPGNGEPIAGYFGIPYSTLNEGYVAACSRFGTPDKDNRVAVICFQANTTETKPVQLCSSFVDIFGIGKNIISGAPNQPVLSSCTGSGMIIERLDFIANGAPVLAVSLAEPMPNGVNFKWCNFTSIGAPPTAPQGLFDLRSPLSNPIRLDDCLVELTNRPLLWFDPDNNDTPHALVATGSYFEFVPSLPVFFGLSYCGVRLSECRATLKGEGTSLFACYSNGGSTNTEIDGLRIDNAQLGTAYPLKFIDSGRYNTLRWEHIYSEALGTLNVSAFVDASFSGDIRESYFRKLSLFNSYLTLNNLRVVDVEGDLAFEVTAATASVEFVSVRTLTPLESEKDSRALLSAPGAVSAKFLNCKLSYRLFFPGKAGTGLFCGTVIGGSSYGLDRLVCLGNPVRQCILRTHSLLKRHFYLNNVLSSTFYPDLRLAGLTPNDINYPILLQGVKSEGIIDSEIAALSQIPNRYAYIADSVFTAREEILQPWFPSIPAVFNPPADQRIFISAGARYPSENTNLRDIGLRSWTYVQRIANRFGPLYLGDSSQVTVLDGSSFAIANPRAFREALNVIFTTIYVRLPGGATYVDVKNRNFDSWSVLTMTAEASLDQVHLQSVMAHLPMSWTYVGDQTLRLSVPQAVLAVDHLDFVVSCLNAPEDAAEPVPVTTLDVTQAGKVALPVGQSTLMVTFTPSFASTPIVVTDLLVPSGMPRVRIEVNGDSVNNRGFVVILPGGPVPTEGYFLTYIAATTH